MATIHQYNFTDKKALIRVDFNVPLDQNQQITDNTRIKAALPTIQKVLEGGGAVILLSHLGRPKGNRKPELSLRHVVAELSRLLGKPVQFLEDCIGEPIQQAVQDLQAGGVLLLENVRFYPQEKKGDENFAKALAELGTDVYINDAFGTAHRAHASTATVAQFFAPENKMLGLLMEQEIANAQKVLQNAQKPVAAILGGAKVSDKLVLIETLLDKVDYLLIGGGMVYTFLKAMGRQIGNSLVEEDKLALTKDLLEKSKTSKAELVLAEDSVIADAFSNDAKTAIKENNYIPPGWMGLDIGIQACEFFQYYIEQSATIFWNGPMGVFEMPNYQHGTKTIAKEVAKATKERGAFTLIGGGDSVAAINQFGLSDQVSYISTGGGAMLTFMEGKTLPGIAAVNEG